MFKARPNIVFIMTDQQRWDALGCYGNPIIRTPHLDNMAANGVRIDQAFVSMPLCVPSRCSIMTGRYPTVTRSHSNGMFLGNDETDLTNVLRNQGYQLALAGKNHCFHPDVLADWDFVYEEDHLGPRNHPDEERLKAYTDERRKVYRRHAVSSSALPFPKQEFGTARITDQANAFLRQMRGSDEPFFLWLSYPDPHPPYAIPQEMDAIYDHDAMVLPPKEPGDFADKPICQWITSQLMGLEEKSDKELQSLIARYYTAVSFIDEAVGEIFKTLHTTTLAKNTLVIFTSDHGDFCGEHSCVEKGPALYDALIRVPLLLYWPDRIVPRHITGTLIESIDLFPTILDYLAVKPPTGVQGQSLKPLLDGSESHHKDAVFGFIGLGERIVNYTRDEAHAHVSRRKEEFDQNPECRFFRWITAERRSNPGVMIRTREWKLIHYVSGEGELYDLVQDPQEFTNLFDHQGYRHVTERLRQELLNFLLQSVERRPPLGFDSTLYASGRVRP